MANESWSPLFIGDCEEGQVAEAHDRDHLSEMDPVDFVLVVMVVRVKAGEEPKRQNNMKDERKLVGTEEDADCGICSKRSSRDSQVCSFSRSMV
jgi:hypothetical protein